MTAPRAIAIVTLLAAIAGCRETRHCDDPNYSFQNGECRPIASGIDGGGDTGSEDAGNDAGLDAFNPCAMCGDGSVCFDGEWDGGDAGEQPPGCVECVDDGQCAGAMLPDAGSADGGVTAGRAICEQFQCVRGCRADGDCGTGGVCRPDQRCSAFGNGQLQCEPCDTEGNCDGASDCIETMFGGGTDGRHCLARSTGTCAGPYPVQQMRTGLDGITTATYCLPPETLTTCEAVLATVHSRPCTSAANCAARGAECHDLGSGTMQCTYPCGVMQQCPSGFVCGTYCHM